MPLVNPSETIDLLRRHGIHLSRRFGQNFLVDANILRKIVDAAEIRPGEAVLEVGAGIGTLTEALADRGAVVTAVEIDHGLCRILEETVAPLPAVTLHCRDALDLDIESLTPPPAKLVANLPYSVAARLLISYLVRYPQLQRYIVMVQREVGERMLAGPASKGYGLFAVKLQLLTKVCGLVDVPRTVFLPRPKVDSVVIGLERRTDVPLAASEVAGFFAFVDVVFGQRRKMLRNVLPEASGASREDIESALAELELSGRERAEELGQNQLLALYRTFRRGQGAPSAR